MHVAPPDQLAATSDPPSSPARSALRLIVEEHLRLTTAAYIDAGRLKAGKELPADAMEAGVERVVGNDSYQIGLLNCCIEVTNFAFLPSLANGFPVVTAKLGLMGSTLELWSGIGTMLIALGKGTAAARQRRA